MSTLSVRLPHSIHKHSKEIARKEGVSINQFISSAVAEKVSAILTDRLHLPCAPTAAQHSRDFTSILD
jgi:hypothetical protein